MKSKNLLCHKKVKVYVTGYIIKKLLKRFGCNDCKHLLLSEENVIEDKYIKLLNRGGLLIPSSNVCFTVVNVSPY